MNAILHLCTHPQQNNQEIKIPENEEEMMENILKFLIHVIDLC